MKLSFVGAVLLISVLNTDAQEYAGSQSYGVYTNYNPQPADPNNIPNLLPPLPPQPPKPYNFPASAQVSYPRPEGNTVQRVDTYFGNPNQQYPPPPPPPPPPRSSFPGDLWSMAASLVHKPASILNNAFGSVVDWLGGQARPYNSEASYDRPVASSQLGAQSEPSNRPYPYNSQVHTSVQQWPSPSWPSYSANSQVGVAARPYNGPPPPPPPPPLPFSNVVGAPPSTYNGPPLPLASSPVAGSSDSNSGSPPAISQVAVPSHPYNGPPPPPPPPLPFSSPVGAPPSTYNGPPPPPLASISVTGSSDSNSGSPPAISQVAVPSRPYNGPPPPPPPPPLPFSSPVTGSSDSNSGSPPANSQTYNVGAPAPSQNAM